MLDKLREMSNAKAAILSFAVLGMFYALIYNDGTSIEEQIAKKQQQIKSVELELDKMAQAEEDARRYRAIADSLGERMEKIVTYIPVELKDFDLMGILSKEAESAGANISNVAATSSGKNSNDEIYEEVKVTVDLEATYTQLLLFLSYITRVERIITLEQMRLNVIPDQPEDVERVLKFNGVFVGYRYLGNANGATN